MASACVNPIQPTTTSNFTTNWFNNSTLSITTHHHHHHQQPNISNATSSSDMLNNNNNNKCSSNNNASDFNFQLSSNTDAMLPADQLFSDGKLLPLHFPTPKPPPISDAKATSLSPQKELQENPHLFSPKAPRCSTRLKELLGFKKTTIKQLLYKNNASSSKATSFNITDASLSSPLLKHSSVSSSSSDYSEDHPRHSLDSSEKPNSQPIKPTGPKLRPVRPKQAQTAAPPPMMESPRMNPSGRVVFEALERSTSCPSSFNGGTKYKNNYYKGTLIERSYSANVTKNNISVRITPVLNVPVCSIRGSTKLMGFGQLFSSTQKKDGFSNGSSNCKINHHCHVNGSKKTHRNV